MRRTALLTALLLATLASPRADAQRQRTSRSAVRSTAATPFQPGNLIVTDARNLREYTSAGVLVQQIPVPHPDTTRYDATDSVVDRRGVAHVLNIAPFDNDYISSFDPTTGLWEHHPITAFLGNVSDGDLHIRAETLYTKSLAISLADFSTTPIPQPAFFSVAEYIAARTGSIYGINSGSPRYEVWELDPIDFSLQRTLQLRDANGFRLDARGLAIPLDGRIFAADWDGRIYEHEPDGTYVRDVPTGAFNLTGIDLSWDGRLTVGSRFGEAVLTDTTLGSMLSIPVGGGIVYSGFVPPRSHVIDFDTALTDAVGVNGQQVSGSGLFAGLVDVTGVAASGNGAALFDSDSFGPNMLSDDPDLLVDRGNVLILQEHPDQTVPGFYDVPDDDRFGGTFTLSFPGIPVAPLSLDLIDICPGRTEDAWVTQEDELGRTRTHHVPAGWTEDRFELGGTGWRTLDLTSLDPQPGYVAAATAVEDAGFDSGLVVELRVVLEGSGAIDDLVFQP